MVKIGIAILLVGLAYSYGVQAEDTIAAQVESIDVSGVSDNKDDLSVSTSDTSDSKSDSEVDLSNNENQGWWPRMPPMPPMFQNFAGFRMPPPMHRMLSLDGIKNMSPDDENTQVFGSGASFSSSQRVVNGQLVEDKQYGKVVTNNNGEVQEKEYGNNDE